LEVSKKKKGQIGYSLRACGWQACQEQEYGKRENGHAEDKEFY